MDLVERVAEKKKKKKKNGKERRWRGRRRQKKREEESKESVARASRKERRRRTEERRQEDFILVTRGDIFNSSNADCGLNPWWALFHIRALELLDPMRDSHTIILDAKPLFHVSLIRSSPAFLLPLLSLCLFPFFAGDPAPLARRLRLKKLPTELFRLFPPSLSLSLSLSLIRPKECSLSSRARTFRSNLGPSILSRFLAGNRAEN